MKPKYVRVIELGVQQIGANRPKWNTWGDNEKTVMDIDRIWIFDISEMDNKRFNAKRSVVRFNKVHIILIWPNRHRSWVTTLPTSQISF